MDELAHIPAGYSYIALKDYRLNPEHPPLIKDLSALPLLFFDLKFPADSRAWKEDINGQWDVGRIFLYESGNDADRIIFWARFPIMLLAVFFGWFFFKTSRDLFGPRVGLLALFFFATSPTIIAHSRYVTTDIAAAFGFFLGIVMFYKFLEKDDKKSLIIAGFSLGLGLLLKFSVFLLIPLYFIFGLTWVFLRHFDHLKSFYSLKQIFFHLLREEGKMLLKLIVIFLTAFLIILTAYQYHIVNYPIELQVRDTKFILGSFGIKPLADLNIWLSDKPILRGFGQYLLGFLMTNQRASAGNTAYYWGEVSVGGWKSYFPMAYLLKEQAGFHLLTFFVLISSLAVFIRNSRKIFAVSCQKKFIHLIEWLRGNFILTMSFAFLGLYWLGSILSPLNIGVRHILPTLPFIYLLVSRSLIISLTAYVYPNPQNFKEWLYSLYERFVKSLPKYFFLGLILLWSLGEIIFTFSHYLSYYNVFAGGTERGWRFIVDSNYDWGQDLKRLKKFVEKNKIEKIHLDYFGGGNPKYYLGEKFEPWWSSKGRFAGTSNRPQGWFAVSATFRQGAWGKPTKGFQIKPEDSYSWLKAYQPVAKAGQSIFIYFIE